MQNNVHIVLSDSVHELQNNIYRTSLRVQDCNLMTKMQLHVVGHVLISGVCPQIGGPGAVQWRSPSRHLSGKNVNPIYRFKVTTDVAACEPLLAEAMPNWTASFRNAAGAPIPLPR